MIDTDGHFPQNSESGDSARRNFFWGEEGGLGDKEHEPRTETWPGQNPNLHRVQYSRVTSLLTCINQKDTASKPYFTA